MIGIIFPDRKDNLTAIIQSLSESLGEEKDSVEKARLEREISHHQKSLAEILDQLSAVRNEMSLVHIYFKELGIVKFSREELFSVIDAIGKIIFWLLFCFVLNTLLCNAAKPLRKLVHRSWLKKSI